MEGVLNRSGATIFGCGAAQPGQAENLRVALACTEEYQFRETLARASDFRRTR